MSSSIEESLSSTGVVGGKRAIKLPPPETYFDTLYGGVEAWYNHLALEAQRRGYGEPETHLADLNIQPMYAGTNQQFSIPLIGGKGKHGLFISVYKRDEGMRVYELTAYIA